MKFIYVLVFGLMLASYSCTGDEDLNIDEGMDASSEEEERNDAGDEMPADVHSLEACHPIRDTNEQGTLFYDLMGYLSLADARYEGKGGFPGHEVVYTYHPERDGTITLSLKSLDPRFDGALYVLSAPENDTSKIIDAVDSSGSHYVDYPLIRCLLRDSAVGDYFDGTRTEHITIKVEAGKTYYVVVDSKFSKESGKGVGPYEIAVFDESCPCIPLGKDGICGTFECGRTDVIDSCWRTSGAFDLFGNFHAEEISCGACDGSEVCDLAAHVCADVPVTPLSEACSTVQDSTQNGLSQFGANSAFGDFSGKEKIHSFVPERSGNISVLLKSIDATFDGALYRLASLERDAALLQGADLFSAGYPESLSFEVIEGETYYVAVDSTSDSGAYSIEIRDETCPCLEPAQEEFCKAFELDCGSLATIDSCGRYSLNTSGSLHLTPCAQCSAGMCDLTQNRCIEASIPALNACEEVMGTTEGGSTLFTNETWLEYGLVYAAGPEAYFSYSPSNSGLVNVRLLEANFRWYVSIYDNTNFSNLITYSDYYYNASNPSLSFQAEAGSIYYIVVDGETLADQGTVKLQIETALCSN